MYRRPVRGVRRLAYRFGHRRMCMDGAEELFHRALQTNGERRFRDQLRRPWSDHVHAEDLVVFLVEHNLDEPFDLAGNARAAEDAELERSSLHVVATLPGLVFGQTDASNLRITICARRDLVVVDLRVILPGDALGEHDAFCRRQVRQLRRAPADRT